MVRAARASAALDGAELPLDQVRRLVGAPEFRADPAAVSRPLEGTVARALRVSAAAAEIHPILATAPAQALARLHLAASGGSSPSTPPTGPGGGSDEVGRPRPTGRSPRDLVDLGPAPSGAELAQRLEALMRLVRQPTSAPVLVLAAVVHGELLFLRPFTSDNGLVARAMFRALIVQRGLDPTGVSVPEVGLLVGGPAAYVGAASAYSSGTARGVALWIQHCATAAVTGAHEGVLVADAVLAGRLSPSEESKDL
jgi:Fic family protein